MTELKTDEEYKKIDEEERKRKKEFEESTRNMFKEFDENNKYWLKFVKDMPKEIQEQIMYASPFASVGVMLWLSIGNAKERDIKLIIVERWKEKNNSTEVKGGKNETRTTKKL